MNYRELPTITKKQEEILILIYRFRFINRHQLQQYFKHKDARRINTWLRDLVTKNYLGRIYSHKLLENTKPAIYYLMNNGIIWIRYNARVYSADDEQLDIKYLKKFYQDRKASQIFINHSIDIFNLYLQLKAAEVKDKLEYETETKTERWISQQIETKEDFDEVKEYIPDLFVYKSINPLNDNIDSSTYFIELFDPHMPRYAIKYRVSRYIKLKESEDWDDYAGLDGKFPQVLLIFPHQQKINLVSRDIREMLERSYASEGLTILVTTYKKAMTLGITNGSKIWQQITEE